MKSFLRILVVFAGVWCMVRTGVYFLPGDPAEFLIHDSLVQVSAEELRQKMNLDVDPLQRLFSLPSSQSLVREESAHRLLWNSALKTLQLGLLALLMAAPLTWALLYLGFRRNGRAPVPQWISVFFSSTPVFVLGPLFLLLIPAPNPALPALVLSLHLMALWHRSLSVRLAQILPQSSVMGGRAMGFSEFRVFSRNLLAPAFGAFLAFLGGQIGTLLNGSLLVEVLFQWNGLGNLLAESVLSRDYPLIELTLMTAAFFSLCAQQLGYAAQRWWDPNLR